MSEKCTVWLCVDSCGDYAVGQTREDAATAYEETIQDINAAEGIRYVQVTVNVPLPVPVELEGTAPDIGQATLAKVE